MAPYEALDGFAANEARLLLSPLAANVPDAATELFERHTRQACSRERFRHLVLKVAARVLLRARQVTVVVRSAVAPLWRGIWTELEGLYPARGSPRVQALPTPV